MQHTAVGSVKVGCLQWQL